MDNKFSSNLIAFLLGIVVFGTDLFTQLPSFDRTGITLFGGYFLLSIYHACKFASSRFSDLTSVVVFWLFPVVFVIIVMLSLMVGIIVSIPKFIISFFRWLSEKKGSKFAKQQSKRYRNHPKSVWTEHGGSNVIPFNFKSR